MKIFNLLNPSVFWFYFKQFILLIKFKNKLILKSYRLSYEKLVDIIIDENSKIYFGHIIHIRKAADIHALEGSEIKIGDNFFMNKGSSIIARYGITIGNDCMIGENTSIVDHNHKFELNNVSFSKQGYKGKHINIGHNVWIASRVFISQGVEIGDNVVIGANTVVTKDIPSNSVVFQKNGLTINRIQENEKNTDSK
jgi:maltose O-acetyltransferase